MRFPRIAVVLLLATWPGVAYCTGFAVYNGNDSGAGSLRQAILDANANPGPDTISWFTSMTLKLKSPLPMVTEATTVGFYFESGLLTIDGSGLGANADGIVAASDNVAINGVALLGFGGNGIVFRGGKGSSVAEAWIGVDEKGKVHSNGGDGILIDGASNVSIGEGPPVLIFGNGRHGIEVRGGSGLKMVAAWVGLNNGDGLRISGGASGARVLNTSSFAANGGHGIEIEDAADVTVQDVRIGSIRFDDGQIFTGANAGSALTVTRVAKATITNPLLTIAGGGGIQIEDSTGVALTSISLTSAKGIGLSMIRSGVTAASLVIDQSGDDGLRISGGSLSLTNATITSSRGDGVRVSDGGTLTVASRLTVSLNRGDGVALLGANGCVVPDAIITGNGGIGALMDNAANNTISTATLRDNAGGPVVIRGAAATGNRVEQCQLDVTATSFGNHYGAAAVLITGGASGNTIAKNAVGTLDGPDIAVQSGERNRLTANTLYPSAGLPIDLGSDANRRQRAPLLARFDGTSVTGVIDGAPGAYDLDVYTHSSGFNLADLWVPLETIHVTTDAAGHFAAPLTFTPQSVSSRLVAATVTDAAGNTSELSAPRGLERPLVQLLEFHGPSYVRPSSVAAVRVLRSGGDLDTRVTVDYATRDDTAQAGLDYTATAGTLTFEKGESVKTFNVPVSDRACLQRFVGCDFYVGLSHFTGAVALYPTTRLTILSGLPPLIVDRVDHPEGDEAGVAMFNLFLAYASSQPMRVDYHTANGTAIAGEDFIAKSGVLTIPGGEPFASIAVPVIGDRKAEPDETFNLVIDKIDGEPSGLTTTATLRNDDGVPVITASGTGAVHFQRSGGNGSPTRVAYEVVALTPAGEILANRDVAVIAGESFDPSIGGPGGKTDVRFTDVVNGVLLQDHLTVNTQAQSPFLVTPSSVTEGDDGVRTVPVSLVLVEPRPNAFDLDYSVKSVSTATAGTDFDLPSGRFHFEPGEQVKTIPLQVHGDRTAEANETIEVELKYELGGFGTPFSSSSILTIRILNDDGPLVTVSADPTRVLDSARCVSIDSLTPLPDGAHLVARDSQRNSRTLDLQIEKGGNHVRGCLQPDDSSAVYIDFDAPEFVRIDRNRLFVPGPPAVETAVRVINTAVEEPVSGLRQARFDVTLSAATSLPVDLSLTTIDGTAVAGSDYVPQTFHLQFAAGETRKTVYVPVIGDGVTEGTEWFFLAQTLDANPSFVTPGAAIIYDPGQAPPAPDRRRAGR